MTNNDKSIKRIKSKNLKEKIERERKKPFYTLKFLHDPIQIVKVVKCRHSVRFNNFLSDIII